MSGNLDLEQERRDYIVPLMRTLMHHNNMKQTTLQRRLGLDNKMMIYRYLNRTGPHNAHKLKDMNDMMIKMLEESPGSQQAVRERAEKSEQPIVGGNARSAFGVVGTKIAPVNKNKRRRDECTAGSVATTRRRPTLNAQCCALSAIMKEVIRSTSAIDLNAIHSMARQMVLIAHNVTKFTQLPSQSHLNNFHGQMKRLPAVVGAEVCEPAKLLLCAIVHVETHLKMQDIMSKRELDAVATAMMRRTNITLCGDIHTDDDHRQGRALCDGGLC